MAQVMRAKREENIPELSGRLLFGLICEHLRQVLFSSGQLVTIYTLFEPCYIGSVLPLRAPWGSENVRKQPNIVWAINSVYNTTYTELGRGACRGYACAKIQVSIISL